MAKGRVLRTLGYITVTNAAVIYGIHLGLSHLEEKYPALPAKAASSKALRTPNHPESQRCAYVDIYAARVPLQALIDRTGLPHSSDKAALEDAWARTIIGSRLLKTEASIAGLFSGKGFEPGDTGDSTEGFADDTTGNPRQLLNGVFTVQSKIAAEDSNGLLVSWNLPDGPKLFFEKISRWGYPWRLMSGGRHEFSISEPFKMRGQATMVEVRFSSAHDYELVDEEGDKKSQKIIPAWVMRLHRGYARLVLDTVVQDLTRESDSH